MNNEIRELLRTINDSWVSNKPEEVSKVLSDCFHQDMVIKGCDLKTMAKGRDAVRAQLCRIYQGSADQRVQSGQTGHSGHRRYGNRDLRVDNSVQTRGQRIHRART